MSKPWVPMRAGMVTMTRGWMERTVTAPLLRQRMGLFSGLAKSTNSKSFLLLFFKKEALPDLLSYVGFQ